MSKVVLQWVETVTAVIEIDLPPDEAKDYAMRNLLALQEEQIALAECVCELRSKPMIRHIAEE